MSWFRCCSGGTESDSVFHPSKDAGSCGKSQEVSETVTIDVEEEVSKPALVTGPVTIDIEMEIPRPVLVSEVPSVAWVIGLDFGTSNSGFAFAQATDNPTVYCHYAWKGADRKKPYCKTLTGLLYTRNSSTGQLTCTSWGHPARSIYMQQQPQQRVENKYLTTLKPLVQNFNNPDFLKQLSPLTPADVVTTYLRLIGEYALLEVERHHNKLRHGKSTAGLFRKEAVQWCLTVPSLWNENEKQRMEDCMVRAGLVTAGSTNRIQIVLEPEAASFYCHQVMMREERKDVALNTNSKILVVDVGGGTVDIVVQEMIGNSQNYKVKELTKSSGGFCGGTYVDDSFMRLAKHRVPPLDEYMKQHPSYKTRLLSEWEDIKCTFGDSSMSNAYPIEIQLPSELDNLLKLELTQQDLKAIFDPVVDEILKLIADQLRQVPDIKVIFVVGGFAGSPYLMRRIRTRFEAQGRHIVSPANPGSAIVYGAVLLALHPDAIVSRVSQQHF